MHGPYYVMPMDGEAPLLETPLGPCTTRSLARQVAVDSIRERAGQHAPLANDGAQQADRSARKIWAQTDPFVSCTITGVQ